MQRFLKLCKTPIIECDSTDSFKSSDNIVRRLYKKHTEGHMDFRIDALVLPEDMIWPSFLAPKQFGSNFKNIYFQRQNTVDINRRLISLDMLRNRGKVIWAGSPGIGKSCDINFILIELLSHLGEDNWPSVIFFRVEDYLYTFTTSGVTRARFKYSDLGRYSRLYQNTNSVLILELQESETDPNITMPFILAVSARNLLSKLKTIDQSGDSAFMLITPPDIEEVCLMAEAIMDICPNNNVFEGQSKEDVVSTVRTRALQVGAIPRYLFFKNDVFSNRLSEMAASASYSLTFDFAQLTINNIPIVAQFLVAPYFRPHVTNPIFTRNYKAAASDYFNSLSEDDLDEKTYSSSLPSYVFRYLSDYALRLHIKALKDPRDIEVIKRLGFDCQLSEAIIKFGGILTSKPDENIDDISSDYWEWHMHVNYNETLSEDSLLPKDKIPVLPRCSAEINFGGKYYCEDVSKLRSDRLYRGTYHNLALYEYFTVDHAKKMIYLYRITSLDLSNHPFALSTIKNVMTKLGMFEDKNLEYKVTLLCFCDWSRRITHGTKFFDTTSANKQNVSLTHLRSIQHEVAVRLEIYIIRALLLPSTMQYSFK